MPSLSGKVVFVTGSSGGIGRATALEFAGNGADVVLQYRSKINDAKAITSEIENLGRRARAVRIDFSNICEAPAQVELGVKEVIGEFGKIDVLVNLAGYPAKGEWDKKFLELTVEDFYKPINVDLLGAFLCARSVAPHMIAQKSGVIVNISSTPALAGHDKGLAFTVAKAGIIGLTKGLATELAPHIRVNAIALGNVETTWISELNDKELNEARQENLMKRFGSPREIAKIIVFLAGDESSFLTGQTIVVDGGTVLH
jgi:3-oxoacyl-[acyl-carrier protein] reductase